MNFEGVALWGIFFLILLWLVVLITSINSLLKRADISLLLKIFWALVICLAPFAGLLFYLVFSKKTKSRLP